MFNKLKQLEFKFWKIIGFRNKQEKLENRLSYFYFLFFQGTPIGKSLNDLYGLFMFLNLDPYCINFWWKKCLFEPYVRGETNDLEQILCQILWRTAKKDVLNQINIPKQTEEIHWLSFSPVEEHFYRRQHIDSSKEAVAKIRKFTNQGWIHQIFSPICFMKFFHDFF